MPKNTELIERKYHDQYVSISNKIVRDKEKTNLLESKIEVLAVYKFGNEMKTVEKKDARGRTYEVFKVDVKASELKLFMGRSDGKAYNEIFEAALALKQKTMIIEDNKGQFEMRSLYDDVNYKNGTLSIEFRPEMEPYYIGLKGDFTKYSLGILFSFKKNGGFQLYKLLRSYAWKLDAFDPSKSQEEQDEYCVSYNLAELRMEMGFVDLTQKDISKEGRKAHPDFEKMANIEKKPQYKEWGDFNRRVLAPGIKEINEISDIYIKSMEKITGGRGGKIIGCDFIIQWNAAHLMKNVIKTKKNVIVEPAAISEPATIDEDELLDQMRELCLEYRLLPKTKELRIIADKAKWEINRLQLALQVLENYQKTNTVDNPVGFLIKAIEEEYEVTTTVKEQKEKKTLDNDFYSNIDIDDIEATLLKKSFIVD